MDYEKLKNWGKGTLKFGGIIIGGAVGGALIGKIAGECVEHIPYINTLTQHIINYFGIQGDIGNLFSFAGLLYGPNIANLALEKNKIKKKLNKLERDF